MHSCFRFSPQFWVGMNKVPISASCASELDLSILPATCTPRIADDQRRAAPALAAGLGFGFGIASMREEDDNTTKFYHMKMLMAICRRILLTRRSPTRI